MSLKRGLIMMAFVIVFGICFISSLITASNKYEQDINNLRKENKILEDEVARKQRLIESQGKLLEEKDEECNCSWYEEYYYSHVGEDVFE